MGRLSVCDQSNQSSRFAVYCGGGVYVHGVSLSDSIKTISTGPLEGAMGAPRRVAIGAMHAARGAGLRAWLVQHPARAIGCNYGAGVAA